MHWLVTLAATLLSCSAFQHRVPVLDLADSSQSYVGTIREADPEVYVVDVAPALRVKPNSGPICSYTLTSHELRQEDIPFAVRVLDEQTGRAEVRRKDGAFLDCEQVRQYHLLITANRCPGNHGEIESSDSAQLKIKLTDVNEFAPEFDREWMETDVQEGRVYDRILRVQATDRDCSPKMSEICSYEITNNAAPFAIDNSGILRNTEPLKWSPSPSSYVVTVVATDCGMSRSKPLLITVNVRKNCGVAWNDEGNKQVNYTPGGPSASLWPELKLNTCDVTCAPETINATIRLARGPGAAPSCDRDTVPGHAECGAHEDTVDLLPKKPHVENGATPSSDGDESYDFDGQSNAILVDPAVTSPLPPQKFTLSFWMRHGPELGDEEHPKQNILCSSDDQKLNRHHFAVFTRNCKLEMLMRKEYTPGEQDKFHPAEWRWHVPEVCDDKWHQYSISMEYPDAHLLVDGRPVDESEKNLEILDDWPMHATKEVGVRMVVGACWHGGHQKMAQFLRGQLSGMTFLAHRTQPASVLACLHQCRESLDFTGDVHDDMEATFNHEMTDVSLISGKVENLEEMIHKVTYVNSKKNPPAGLRTVTLDTSLKCKDQDIPLQLPTLKTFIDVQGSGLQRDPMTPAGQLNLVVTGDENLTATFSEVNHGINLFPNLKIRLENDDGDHHLLSWCKITVRPALNKDHEYFSTPASLIGSYELNFEHVGDGLQLAGQVKMSGYEQVLDKIHYFNQRPDLYPDRLFSVQCSLSAAPEVASNVLPVHLKIERDPVTTAAPAVLNAEKKPKASDPDAAVHAPPEDLITKEKAAHAPDPPQVALQDETGPDQFGPVPLIGERNHGFSDRGSGSAGSVVAIVVVVCVGLLLLLVIVGILKLRSSTGAGGKRKRDSHLSEFDWDNEGLNIRVNPIEELDAESGRRLGSMEDSDPEYSSDEIDSDERDSEDDEPPVLPHVEGQKTGLEWDDSTLHTPMSTYRV